MKQIPLNVRWIVFLLGMMLVLFVPCTALGADYPAPKTGCLAPDKCHVGIEPIRAHDSEMAKQIYEKGAALGDPNGCVVCHGGDPKEEKDAKKRAHRRASRGVTQHLCRTLWIGLGKREDLRTVP